MKKNSAYLLFWFITGGLALFCLLYPPQNFGGDIVEYHGITESLIKSGGIRLTEEVKNNLARHLQPAYLEDPGYYITGVDGERYPVHFIFYSFLALPIRLILKLFQINELNTLRFTNLFILTASSYYIMKHFLPGNFKKIVFILLLYLSPIIWFLLWPGPDLYYLMMLLISIFFFYNKRYVKAALFAVLASWHSQPLVILSLFFIGYYLVTTFKKHVADDKTYIGVFLPSIGVSAGMIGLMLLPFLYNLILFGTLTPWTILQDGWTMMNGFGIHNASIKKFVEQLFDLNFGLFWYMPVIFILGFSLFLKRARQHIPTLALLLAMVVNAFFYQTNPAWHYGTSGFGPSRHAIFMLPFVLYFAAMYFTRTKAKLFILFLLLINQLNILHFNGYLAPNLLNTLEHSPYARFVLHYAPSLYNPTPEIFVDRTNHLDITYPKSAIYISGNTCKKAYMLITEKEELRKTCGSIPPEYEAAFDNPLVRKTNFERTVRTVAATIWPDPGSCGDNYFPTELKAYKCLLTKDEAIAYLGIYDPSRLHPVENLPGVWRIDMGTPLEFTLPPGYIAHHYAFEGVYVNY